MLVEPHTGLIQESGGQSRNRGRGAKLNRALNYHSNHGEDRAKKGEATHENTRYLAPGRTSRSKDLNKGGIRILRSNRSPDPCGTYDRAATGANASGDWMAGPPLLQES